jgi:hypothetical protein
MVIPDGTRSAVAERVDQARPRHAWWGPLQLAFVPGVEHPVLTRLMPEFLEHLRRTGHEVHETPGPRTNLLLTTARFGVPVPWRRALMLSHRRAFGLAHSPTVMTVVVITPDELAAILHRLERSLAKEPPDPAEFSFPGLTERAHRVLIEQGRRGGPMLSLVRLVQSQAICIRVVLLVADDRPRHAYIFDLVGAHPRLPFDEPAAFYEDLARRMATAVSTQEVTEHLVQEPALNAATWRSLETPPAMMRASLELGARSFFTEMVRVADLVNVPGLDRAVASQYSEGCFATWEPRIAALVTTITGSARPVDKGRITEDELALIVGVRPDAGAAIETAWAPRGVGVRPAASGVRPARGAVLCLPGLLFDGGPGGRHRTGLRSRPLAGGSDRSSNRHVHGHAGAWRCGGGEMGSGQGAVSSAVGGHRRRRARDIQRDPAGLARLSAGRREADGAGGRLGW